jgi:anti-sigma factor RsiW
MNCEIALRLMETDDAALAEHLLTCPSCAIGAHATYYEAPPSLEQKIRQSLRRETSRSTNWRWLAMAACLLLGVSLTGNLALLRSRVDLGQVLAEDVVSAHVRSLAGTHLIDVPSSDQHTVKPWFNGKLDFAPTVKEVQGFPLLGGRLEYLQGHPAAAMIYGRAQHVINLFTWPAAKAGAGEDTFHGYHLLSWWANGMTYWAVSDLNLEELRQFVEGYRGK